jgi:uncharacterized phage-associated protein
VSNNFREDRVTQASAVLLKEAGGKMPYMLLVKLLYLADRESLKKFGYPITFDEYFSMELGPILSNTLNLIKNRSLNESSSSWRKSISLPKNYYIELKDTDISYGELSKVDIEILKSVYSKYGHMNRFELSRLLHKQLPEYKVTTRGNRYPITYHDILSALGDSEEEILRVEEEIGYFSLMRA